MRRLALFLGLSLGVAACPGAVTAQGCGQNNPNCIVATPPVGASDNRAASTAFVAGQALTVSGPLGINPATSPARLRLNPQTAAQQATIDFQQTNALYWQLGKLQDNSFFLFDAIRGANVFDFFSNGELQFMVNGGITQMGSLATWPISSYNFASAGGIFNVVDPTGQAAVTTAVRTSDWTGTLTPNSIAVSMLNVHDRTTGGPTGSWGTYVQSNKTATASSVGQIGGEYDLQNLGPSVLSDPFNPNPAHFTETFRVGSGIGPAVGNNVTTGFNIVNNGKAFNTGIQIQNGAIANDGTGIFRAISLPTNNSIVWFSSAGVIAGELAVDNSSILQIAASGGVNVNGVYKGTGLTATAAAPTVAAAQIGYGSTTVAAGASTGGGICPTGVLGGATVAGCIIVNIGGTQRGVPFF